MTIRIAFIGKMGAGKSFTSSIVREIYPHVQKLAFADPIKKIAVEHFGMTHKDRRLLQVIGTTGRLIHPTVWTDKLIRNVKDSESYVIDDVRYKNECEELRNKGFCIVYLDVTESVRIQRIKNAYGEQATQHIENMNDPSEMQLVPDDADLVWENQDLDCIKENIARFRA